MTPQQLLTRAAGGGVGIALMMTLADAAATPLMTVPFATSIVLVMGAPESAPARPRAVFGGHLVSAFVGVACTVAFGDAMWASALGVAIAMGMMFVLDVFHPPAGISPLIITTAHATPLFILSPAGIGALILVGFAFVFHSLAGEHWPERWV